MQQQCQLTYQGHTLTPKPDSIKVQHHFEPQLPSQGGLREHNEHAFYVRHKTVFMAGLLGVAFLLVIMLVLAKLVNTVFLPFKNYGYQVTPI